MVYGEGKHLAVFGAHTVQDPEAAIFRLLFPVLRGAVEHTQTEIVDGYWLCGKFSLCGQEHTTALTRETT